MKHYDALGIPPSASTDDIKQAYRRKAQESHPDKGGAAEVMAMVNEAYAVLGDPARRSHYDATGDPYEDPLEDEARAALKAVFDKLLEVDGDVVSQAHQGFVQAIQDAESKTPLLKARIVYLRQRLGRVVTLEGPNLFDLLVQERIHAKERELTDIGRRIVVGRKVLKLLSDYRFTGVTPTAPTAPDAPWGSE